MNPDRKTKALLLVTALAIWSALIVLVTDHRRPPDYGYDIHLINERLDAIEGRLSSLDRDVEKTQADLKALESTIIFLKYK